MYMTNKWIEYIKTEAIKNNFSYGCALSNKDIINNYKKVTKKTKADKDILKQQIITNQTMKLLKDKIKNIDNEDIPIMRMRYNSYSPTIKDEFKNKYPKYYNNLFN